MDVCGFPQHWSKLDTTRGPSPSARYFHAACCIAGPLTGKKHPRLLVGGGYNGWEVFKDMWLLDVDREVWNEVSDLIDNLVYDELHQELLDNIIVVVLFP